MGSRSISSLLHVAADSSAEHYHVRAVLKIDFKAHHITSAWTVAESMQTPPVRMHTRELEPQRITLFIIVVRQPNHRSIMHMNSNSASLPMCPVPLPGQAGLKSHGVNYAF